MHALAHMEFSLELKSITMKPCEYCFARKQHRVAFRTRLPRRAKNFLDIVHNDVCSMTKKSINRALDLRRLHQRHLSSMARREN